MSYKLVSGHQARLDGQIPLGHGAVSDESVRATTVTGMGSQTRPFCFSITIESKPTKNIGIDKSC